MDTILSRGKEKTLDIIGLSKEVVLPEDNNSTSVASLVIHIDWLISLNTLPMKTNDRVKMIMKRAVELYFYIIPSLLYSLLCYLP